ncbi:MAG: DUF1833 family protein, partial [Desulfuromonadales bacterium]|nr:DUF1833 family protein [Desulfuromonadales bacterium]
AFTRASTALLSDGVTVVDVDQPRFEAGRFGQAIMVEAAAGDRAAESLTIPGSIFDWTEGTFEVGTFVPAWLGTAARNSTILGHGMDATTNLLGLYHLNLNAPLNSWAMRVHGPSGPEVRFVPNTLTAGWHDFALRWLNGGLDLLIDGIVAESFAAATLPVASPAAVQIGSWWDGGSKLNSLIDQVRISSRARSDAEIAAAAGQALRVDPHTTALFGFDGHLGSPYVYQPFPFDIALPADRDDQISKVTLTIDNVDRAIVRAVRELASAPTVTLEIVLASSPDVVEAGPFEFTLQDAGYDALTVSGTLGYEDILNEPFPAGAFVPAAFPGMF